MTSYCVTCDALPGGCEHGAARYLDPIVYEQELNELGKHVGWSVPDHERERWDNPPAAVHSTPAADRTPKSIQKLIVELDDYIYLSDRVEADLRAAYERKPTKVARLVEHVVTQTKDGKLDNPGGYLVSQLKEL